MPITWLLLLVSLFFSLCMAVGEVHLWTSQVITTWTSKSSLDSVCNSEYTNGFAIVCRRDQNVSQYFDEGSNVLTRDVSGTKWDNSTFVAIAGEVKSTMFGYGTLGNTIKTILGETSATNDQVSTGCDEQGGDIPSFSCDGYYGSPVNYSSNGRMNATSYDWLISSSGISCTAAWRVYCLEIPAPTPLPTPIPTSLPFSDPTPSPTYAPTTLQPTVNGGTRPPTTRRPSRAPSTLAPVAMQPPTVAPTCSTCSAILIPSLNNSNTSVLLGDPSDPVIITVPSHSIPNCSSPSCSVHIIVSPLPPTPLPFGGDSILSIDVYDGALARDNVTLDIPITFLIPFTSSLKGCTGAKHMQCEWREGGGWAQSGCVSAVMSTGTLCTCTHLTDFAVLLDLAFPHPCSPTSQIPEIYYVFIALYILVFCYCLFVICGLIKQRTVKETYNAMLLQHTLIFVITILRVLSCLAYLDVFGEDKSAKLVLTSFVAAAPYPLEYLLFTKLASTWAGLVHFAMLSADARWIKIRPLFYTLNVCGTCLAIALFVVFVLDTSFYAAVGGTCVLSFLYLSLGVVFNVYATKILSELSKGSSNNSNSSTNKKAASSVADKIRWVGRGATLCFVAQALCSILALVCPSDQLAGWTAAFLLFNVLALVCVLAAYYAAVKKAIFKKDLSLLSDRDLFSKSGPHLTSQSSAVSGSELINMQKQESR